MNERIKELAEQARLGRGPEKIHISENGVVIFYHDELEKFAEMIVRECADLFEVEWGSSMLQGTTAAHYLKQHFGVEE